MGPFDLRGKVILVTGGTRGLGRSVSLQLARAGATVVSGYFNNEVAAEAFRKEAALESLPCHTVKANLMTSAGIQACRDQALAINGRVDGLVYCSATGVHKPLDQLTARHLATVWQVNVGAFFDLAVKLLPSMPAGSRIVAISSEGANQGIDQYGAIGSSKGALESLCRQMAVEWAPRGIHVNAIAPGLLRTETLEAMPDADARVRYEMAASPLGRLVTLEEVARVVHFLCAPASEGIVGQTLAVDGGKRVSSHLPRAV
jgi:NAD(P)-dependent dehydrogenase (short-subunit alcohol dehydrogenase family)